LACGKRVAFTTALMQNRHGVYNRLGSLGFVGAARDRGAVGA
jgi:hypothetical protein